MIHRGVQYSRAIRKYFKKYGRYPTKLEDLDSSNNTRYLRKHYKDPVTGKDFKLLHYGDPGVLLGGGAGLLGAAPAAASGQAFGSQPGAFGGNGQAFGSGPAGSQLSGLAQQQGFGGIAGQSTLQTPPGIAQTTGDASGGAYAPNSGGSAAAGIGDSTGSSTPGPTFGGGPIVGVVSASKKDTIREFSHKKKYNEWQFIYDPSSDRGGLLMTPNQPSLQGAVNLNGQPPNGQPPNPNGSPFGTPSQNNNINPQNNPNQAPGTPTGTDQPPQ